MALGWVGGGRGSGQKGAQRNTRSSYLIPSGEVERRGLPSRGFRLCLFVGGGVRRLGRGSLGGGHELPEARELLGPVVEDGARLGGARLFDVRLQQVFEERLARLRLDALDGDNLGVDVVGEGSVLVEKVAEPARHPGADVAADFADGDDASARHVLAAVVAGALDDRLGEGVAHGEALAGAAVDKEAPARGTVEAGVADEGGVGGGEGGLGRRRDGDLPPRHALADVVVRLSHERHLHTPAIEAPERLPRGAAEGKREGAREALVAVPLRHLPGDAGARAAVRVDNLHLLGELRLLLDALHNLGVGEDFVVEHGAVGVRLHRAPLRGGGVGHADVGREEGEVEVGSFRERRRLLDEEIVAADNLVEGAVPHARQRLANLVGDKDEEVHEVRGGAGEARAELLALRRHAHGAVVGVADARHDAARRDHRDGAKPVLVRAHEGGEHHIRAALEPAVTPQHHAVSKPICEQSLVRLHQPHLNRPARVLDRADGRRPSAAVVPGHLDHVRVRLGHPAAHCPDARLAHELDAHLGVGVDHVQVIDQLREILDGVDVVMRRRRDERDARLAAAERSDVRRNLLPRELTAFAGLGALRHLDLELLRVHQKVRRHAETPARNLLDGARGHVAVLERLEVREGGAHAVIRHILEMLKPDRVLATLAAVALAADAVHGNGDRLVRLARDGAQRHAPRAEAVANVRNALHLIDRDWLAVALDLEHVAQARRRARVDVLLKSVVSLRVCLPTAKPDRLVQQF
mmetsp:Transcript_9151/g.30124  ORF Transcript_9151/g.30124 Transcript_9151/m.30124 type:complete len:751 (-) Transcript_9151:185-2437(-)